MKYDIGICKRGRKCSKCSASIVKDEKFFTQTSWMQGDDYPTKKTVCLNCLEKISEGGFIKFLEDFLGAIKSKQSMF